MAGRIVVVAPRTLIGRIVVAPRLRIGQTVGAPRLLIGELRDLKQWRCLLRGDLKLSHSVFPDFSDLRKDNRTRSRAGKHGR